MNWIDLPLGLYFRYLENDVHFFLFDKILFFFELILFRISIFLSKIIFLRDDFLNKKNLKIKIILEETILVFSKR